MGNIFNNLDVFDKSMVVLLIVLLFVLIGLVIYLLIKNKKQENLKIDMVIERGYASEFTVQHYFVICEISIAIPRATIK